MNEKYVVYQIVTARIEMRTITALNFIAPFATLAEAKAHIEGLPALNGEKYTGKQPDGQFYIQSKGLHSGRPLKTPIANCIVVYTDDELLFEKVYSLYIGRFFEVHIGGSVVPFIRIGDVKEVIEQSFTAQVCVKKELDAVRKIDELLLNLHSQIKHYKMLKVAICRKIYSA